MRQTVSLPMPWFSLVHRVGEVDPTHRRLAEACDRIFGVAAATNSEELNSIR